MKKAIIRATTVEPSSQSLREMPEVDFSKYRIRKNPYAAKSAREGIEGVHNGPSAASLREMPEADFGRNKPRRNKFGNA